MFYDKILSRNQREIVPKLGFLKDSNFYLAGGTALAIQLEHRTSVDLDFYTETHFDSNLLANKFKEVFPKVLTQKVAKDTIFVVISGVSLSFFFYPYKLIKPAVIHDQINIASCEDIAAMKVAAIVQRGKRRDFVDLYYLLQKYGLSKIINLAIKKYPGYQPMIVLKALIYFKDAEDEGLQRGIKILDKGFSWEKAKKKIFEEVKNYQLGMFKK